MDYRALESKVMELEKRSADLEEFQKGAVRSLRNVKNSPIVMGYEGKRFDLNDSLDVVKLLGRVKALEGGGGSVESVGASWFDEWLAGPPKVSLFDNDVGYLTAMSEVDPVFTSWVGSSPDISVFNNNVGYLTLGSIADDLTVGHLYPSAAYKNIGASDNKWYNLYVGGTAHLAGVQITGDASYVSLNMTNTQAVDAMSRIFFTNGLGDSAWIGFMSEGMNVWDYYPNILYINGNGHVDFCDNTIWDIGKLGIKEGGASPEYQTFFQGGNQSGDITYTLPTASAAGYLTNNGSGVLSWSATATATAHNILDSTYHSDVLTGSILRGDILYGNSTPKIARLAKGNDGQYLKSGATDVVWADLPGSFSGFANPSAAVGNTVVNGSATTAMRSDAAPALGNLGTQNTIAKFGATGLADSIITQPNAYQVFLPTITNPNGEGLFVRDGSGYGGGLQSIDFGGYTNTYFCNNRYFTGAVWAGNNVAALARGGCSFHMYDAGFIFVRFPPTSVSAATVMQVSTTNAHVALGGSQALDTLVGAGLVATLNKRVYLNSISGTDAAGLYFAEQGASFDTTKLSAIQSLNTAGLTLSFFGNNRYYDGVAPAWSALNARAGCILLFYDEKLQLYQSAAGGTLGTKTWGITASGGMELTTDGVVISCGVDSEVTLTHNHNVGLTLNENFTMTTAKWLGLGAAKGKMTFTDAATDTITFDSCNVGIGTTAPAYTLDVTGNFRCSTGFSCNSKTPQTAYASGGALAAYGAGTNGLNSDANMSALHALVVSMRAALVANGIMS